MPLITRGFLVKFFCLLFWAGVWVIVSIFPQIHRKDKLYSVICFKASEQTKYNLSFSQLKYSSIKDILFPRNWSSFSDQNKTVFTTFYEIPQ